MAWFHVPQIASPMVLRGVQAKKTQKTHRCGTRSENPQASVEQSRNCHFVLNLSFENQQKNPLVKKTLVYCVLVLWYNVVRYYFSVV